MVEGGPLPGASRTGLQRALPWVLRLGWWVVATALVLVLGFHAAVDLALALVLAILAVRAGGAQLAVLLCSLVVSLSGLEAAVRIVRPAGSGPGRHLTPEHLTVRDQGDPALVPPPPRYQPNVDVVLDTPHGDLVGIEPSLPRSLWEPTTIRFATDPCGFRNDQPYRGQPLLMAGDSFVVGNGTDQPDHLVNLLRDLHRLDAYSVAHPAIPDHYFVTLEWAFTRLPGIDPDARAVVVFFEGNDFLVGGQKIKRPVPEPRWYDQHKLGLLAHWTPGLIGPRVLFNLNRRLERSMSSPGEGAVEVRRVGGGELAFLGSYVDAARAPHLELNLRRLLAPALLGRLAAVVFAPTKYRVYASVVENGRPDLPEPPPGLEALHRVFGTRGIPVLDLTPALTEQALALLPQERYLYRRDDSHWNAEGTRVAAEEIVRLLAQTNRGPVAPSTPEPTL